MVKSVLSVLLSYAMQTCLLLKGACNDMEKLIRRFLWGGTPDKRGVHLVKWEEVVKPEINGGLGVRRLQNQNDALLMMIAFRLISQHGQLSTRHVTVSDMAYSNGDWEWNLLHSALPFSILLHVMTVEPPSPNGGPDIAGWKWDKNKNFSTRSSRSDDKGKYKCNPSPDARCKPLLVWWFKLNTDGSKRLDPSLATCGGGIRDHRGVWVSGFAKPIGCCTTLDAEVWGILESVCCLGPWVEEDDSENGQQGGYCFVPPEACIEALKEITGTGPTFPPPSKKKPKNAAKFDPTQVVDVFVRVTGGEVGAASSLAPKMGPLGLSPKKIGEDIAKETAKDWKGLRVTVKLTVQNRQAKVTVVPAAAALVIKALKEPERDRKKTKNIKHNGNISLDDVIEIAKIMRPRSMAKDLRGTVKEILARVFPLGVRLMGKILRIYSRRLMTEMLMFLWSEKVCPFRSYDYHRVCRYENCSILRF
ncbi:60S ribosomal protein L12 [Hibiscus syriacus]|uniref:60S ribosomal protein L12 n=1 Tax=Hibiscus syriacus TaxID=106335 RepID=A0A6A3AA24_HIBSY|nr:60S ribosomal protein L12 [Hibiscus syriacus]